MESEEYTKAELRAWRFHHAAMEWVTVLWWLVGTAITVGVILSVLLGFTATLDWLVRPNGPGVLTQIPPLPAALLFFLPLFGVFALLTKWVNSFEDKQDRYIAMRRERKGH